MDENENNLSDDDFLNKSLPENKEDDVSDNDNDEEPLDNEIDNRLIDIENSIKTLEDLSSEQQDFNFRIQRIEGQYEHLVSVLPRLKREKIEVILTHMKELAKDLELTDSEYAPLMVSDHFEVIDDKVRHSGHKTALDYSINLLHKLMAAISVEHVVRRKILITMNLLNNTLKEEYEKG
jgi:predicted nuclease with TOPRIM domain